MSTTPLFIPLANGVTVVPLNAGSIGQMELTLRAQAAPSAGTMKIEGLTWSNTYIGIENASAINLTSIATGISGGDFGHFQALRFTLTGVTGGAGVIAGAATFNDAASPDFAYTGFRALTTQSYVEANVKNGVQFYFQYQLPIIPGGGTSAVKIAFVTAALPVLIKDRNLYALGNSVSLQIFKQPTGITGGTAIPVQNYNDISSAASTVTVTGNVTTTTNGTSWGDPTHIYGTNTAGSRSGSGLAPGADRILKPNSSYLVVVTNLDTTGGTGGQALCDYYLTWYEGKPDLPRQ